MSEQFTHGQKAHHEREAMRAEDANEQATYDALMEHAHTLGADHGRAAASWYFDGNTTRETYERTLGMIEDGDPAIYDTFPSSPLSGEWAGDPSSADVFRALEICEDDDAADDALRMYEDGYGVAVSETIERMAREALADDVDDAPTVRDLANDARRQFTSAHRDDGTEYTKLTDDARTWVRDLVYDAHDGMLPDDHRYYLTFQALCFIADEEDWDDRRDEWADSMVDAYSSALMRELLGHDRLRLGQLTEAREVFDRVACVLEGWQD